MKIAEYLQLFIDKRVWLFLEGTHITESEKKEAELALYRIVGNLEDETDDFHLRPSRGIICNNHHLLWLVARLLRKLKVSSDLLLLTKCASLESLLSLLKAPQHIAMDVRKLNRAIINSKQSGKEIVLPSHVAEYFHDSIIRGEVHATTGLVNHLLSPYLSHLSGLDYDLLKIIQESLHAAFQSLENKDQQALSAIVLHLLAVVGDASQHMPKIHQLSIDGVMSQKEILLALLSRKETPPACSITYCQLAVPSEEEILKPDGTLNVQNAFLLQSCYKKHWILDYLSGLYGALSESKTDIIGPSIQELSPIIQYYLWTQHCCESSVISKFLTHSMDPTLQRLEHLLVKREMVTSWLKKQPSYSAETTGAVAMSLLNKHSALRVLHQSGVLLDSDWDDVLKLLKSCKEDDKKSVSWECVVFQGYIIMMKTMKLFLISWDSKDHQPKSFEQYKENSFSMKEELSKIQALLKKLYPLSYRLEILENIFSLLFLRFEHLKADEGTSDSGGEDDDSLKSLATVTESSLSPVQVMNQPNFIAPSTKAKTTAKRRNGFICGPLIIRDALSFMKECLIDCSSSVYKHKSDMEVKDNQELQKKISSFCQIVTEAWWRLQIVTDLTDVIDYEKKSMSCIPQPQRGYLSSASSSESDDELGETRSRKRKTSQRSSRSENTDKSSGSGSNTTGGLMLSSGGRSKRLSRRKSRALNKLPNEADSIVNILLASQTSLAVLCLSRGDYRKAQQVVQTFQLANSEVANEANFLELFNSLSLEVSKSCDPGSNSRDFAVELGQGNSQTLASSSLDMVRRAALMGMNAVSVTSLVEKVLALAPPVHGMEKLLLENRRANMILCDISDKVMVSVDAALCLGNSGNASSSLMDVVSQHIKFNQTKPGVKGRGYSNFVSSFMELYRFLRTKKKCGSAAETLGNWEIPLNANTLSNYISFTSSLQDDMADFLNSDCLSKEKIVKVRQIIKTLADSNKCYELRGVRDAGKEELHFLQDIVWYLQTLSFILNRCAPASAEALSNPFDLLEEHWEQILSRLIFDYEAPLGRVERVSKRLNLHLLEAVVGACCPHFQQSIEKKNCAMALQPAASAWAKVSLNAATCQQDSKEDPAELGAKILTELLAAIKQSDAILVNSNDLQTFSNNSEILQILGLTTKLSSVDLTLLEENPQRAAFLCNICNLLMLHSLITLGCDSGLTSNSWLERKAAYNCIGYHIGQMGFVTLSSLLKQLVGMDFDSHFEDKICSDLMWNVDNKMALFAVSQGTIHGPFIQVYGVEQLESQLKTAVVNYISHNVRVEGSLEEGCFSLLLTPLILQYLGISSLSSLDAAVEASREYLLPLSRDYLPDTCTAIDCAPNIPTILKFLEAYATGQLKLQVADWKAAWENVTDDKDCNGLVVTVEDSTKFGILLQSSIELLGAKPEDQPHLDATWENCNLNQSVLQFISKRCWIIALLAERLRRGVQEYQFYPHTESLDRYLAEKFALFSSLGSGNLILGALTPPHMLLDKIWPLLDQCVVGQHEDECIQVFYSLPESMIFENVCLQTFKELLLYFAASQPQRHGIEAPHRLALSLGTAELRAQCILRNIQHWSGDDSIEVLKTVLGDPEISKETRAEVSNALKRVTIYQQVHNSLCYYKSNETPFSDGWHQILLLSDSDPGKVLQVLIEAKKVSWLMLCANCAQNHVDVNNNLFQFRLCMKWADLHGIPCKANHLIDCNLVAPLLESENIPSAKKLLESVPMERAVSICRRLLGSLTSMESLQFIVNFALTSCKSWLKENARVLASLQLWSVGLSILSLLPAAEQERDRAMVCKPQLLLEQMVMNTKLALCAEALAILRSHDMSAIPSDHPAQPAAIDAMLRSYANKALDFRVVQRIEPSPPELDDLLISMSSGSISIGPVPFIMPPNPPLKSDWVPNDEARDCMCCQLVPFTMFNRRHHCRRCGRVVCGSCSCNRSKVDGYGELLVRICDDCNIHIRKDTAARENKNADHSHSSSVLTCIIEWVLCADDALNTTVREEFSFEHAPSVALCLSILALHTEHSAAQPRFLLEASENMLRLLALPTPGVINPELDYSLVIKMARSLVVAAKVRYAKAALNSGIAHCDRVLGQVDVLSLLVRNGCSNFLPVEPLPLSGHALRHLRDRLLTAELWALALEVSTKAGLDRTGVWAAWGKACLRAGKWLEAREHLAHCLQPLVPSQDAVPAPLLSEIIRILEDSSYVIDSTVIKQSEHINSPALSVLHTLSNLSAISQGKIPMNDSTKQSVFYSECQYYLQTYGTPSVTISFLLSRGDLKEALRFVKDKNVEPEIFADALYKPCLVQGLIAQLLEEMRKMDPSLDTWKNIIMHVARLLEQQGLLNSLYQLQLFARDLVRAAMTCIRFYKASARCYSDMNADHLVKARGHIEDELSEHWASADSKRRESSVCSGRSSESPDGTETECQIPLKMPARTLDHHVNTIVRQLEAAKFLVQCESEDRTAVVTVSAELCQMKAPAGKVIYIPTLFGDSNERTLVAALILLCGKNIEEGFGITFRIIQYFRLKANNVYSLVAEYLVNAKKSKNIPQLINCIQSSGSADAATCSDDLLLQCIKRLVNEQSDGIMLSEPLLRHVAGSKAKIEAHLTCGFLKSAYLLAVKSGKEADVKLILDEAERTNQSAMKRICQQWLSQRAIKK
ncbi:Hypothetical predicted protein [Cloeon dipterum]|uniref:FYVE-type domain-containing protein n=1 Tax=Cloeon dipterum TaxID=197152 RepID=A0A8S1DSB2_9INSE|nr:Hypothetical predicted protein [Cloeon dipterum]